MAPKGFVMRAAARGLRPDPRMPLSEWADRYAILPPEAGPEAGRWTTHRVPYLREIMDRLSPHDPTETIVVMKGSQIGYTQGVILNFIGSIIHQTPAPTMVVMPKQDLAFQLSRERLQPMLRKTPVLAERIQPPRSRDAENTITFKRFPSGFLLLAGANSPSDLSFHSIKFLALDEVDRFPRDCGGEGSPVELALTRTSAFENSRKVVIGGTPTVAGLSEIERRYLSSDQYKYHVPCPRCGAYQEIVWENLVWEKAADGNHLPDTVRLRCVSCKALIEEHHKETLLPAGEWVCTARHGNDGRVRGYHISSLYAPLGFYSWPHAVRDFLEAKKDPVTLKTFINTKLGLTWTEDAERTEPEHLAARVEKYDALQMLPAGVALITAAVDVQADRLECEVRGWGADYETWGLQLAVFGGRPDDAKTWAALDHYLMHTRYPHPSGEQIRISITTIDSGNWANLVYDYCRPRWSRNVFAVKGVGGAGRPAVISRNKSKTNKVYIYRLGVDTLKDTIHARLKLREPGPGYLHWPDNYDMEYFRQVCAEERRTRYSKGFPISEWHKTRPRNEGLDLLVYNLAALEIKGVDPTAYAKALARLIAERGGDPATVLPEKGEGEVALAAVAPPPPEKKYGPPKKAKPKRKPQYRNRGWLD